LDRRFLSLFKPAILKNNRRDSFLYFPPIDNYHPVILSIPTVAIVSSGKPPPRKIQGFSHFAAFWLCLSTLGFVP
jgi:hypothetical protein